MAKLQQVTISRRTVEKLSVEKDTVFWDRDLPGFGVRVYATGSKVYVAQARAGGHSRRVTIGRQDILTPEEARKRAALVISRLKSGQSTSGGGDSKSKGPTVAEFARKYLAEHVEVRLKPNTIRDMCFDLNHHILPAWGKLPMISLDRKLVVALHSTLYRTPAAANRMVGSLSAMFSMAESWDIVPEGTNPCRGMDLYRTGKAERFLTEAEFKRLGQTVTDMEADGKIQPGSAAAIRLLMLTGCRCNEILRLRWDEVDLERGELRLQDSKTGQRTVPLSPAAARVIAARPRAHDDTWVIPGKHKGRPLSKMDRAWSRVRKRAGLEDVRLHDLRHSFASRALALGESLPMISKLLGHAQIQTTARYAHLAEHSVRKSAARIAASIGEDLFV